MRSRGLVVVIALVLAIAAAAAVILYTNGVKQAAETGGNLKPVIVATQDIPANTNLDDLINSGAFKQLNVPAETVVDGAITSLDELKGQTTTSPLVANEQVSLSRLSGGQAPKGGALGISPGHIAITIKLDAPQGGNGAVQRGDDVTIYATFNGASVIKGTIPQLVAGNGTQVRNDLPDFTVTLIPTVRVLQVENPAVDPTTGKSDGSNVVLTLDLTKQDAQNLVFAQENALVWVGLLPPGEKGAHVPPSTVPISLLLGKKAA